MLQIKGGIERGLVTLYCMVLVLYAIPAAGEVVSEYAIKAGYIYRFMLFTRWPDRDHSLSDEQHTDSRIIGIYGSNPFGDVLEQLEGRTIHGHKLAVKYLDENSADDELINCDVIFLAKGTSLSILSKLEGFPVLTISDMPDFVDKGGMIEFVTHDNHIKFAINRKAAYRNDISFSAQLLKVAVRIVEQ